MRSVWLVFLVACGSGSQAPAPRNEGGSGEVTVRTEPAGSGTSLVIENGTANPVRFAREIVVQTKEVDIWVPVSASNLFLREQCDDPRGGLVEPPACVEIPAGATFRAAPWTHMVGDAQCACEECGPVATGGYKLGVTPCDGGDPVWAPVFRVDGRE